MKSLYDTELQLGELGQNQQKQTLPKPVRTSPRNKDARVVSEPEPSTEPEPSLTMATPANAPAINPTTASATVPTTIPTTASATVPTTTPTTASATAQTITPTTASATAQTITPTTATASATVLATTPTTASATTLTTSRTTAPVISPTTTAATPSIETASTRPDQSNQRTTHSEEYVGDRFWTSCPYCYMLYEYPKIYEECTLRCQNCRRAFHAATVPPPPVTKDQRHLCCWANFPLGFSGNAEDANGIANWSPFSPMFSCPTAQGYKNAGKAKKTVRRFTYDDEDVDVELSNVGEDEEYDDDLNGRMRD